jgi:hypothetical protein
MSTSPKHSPGPWDYQLVRNGDDPQYPELRIYDADGDAIIQQSQSGYDTFTAITIEDARIIAAAPKMLEALKDCRDLIENMPVEELLMQVEAAIAKAEGRVQE